jgi:hypothetical protein
LNCLKRIWETDYVFRITGNLSDVKNTFPAH